MTDKPSLSVWDVLNGALKPFSELVFHDEPDIAGIAQTLLRAVLSLVESGYGDDLPPVVTSGVAGLERFLRSATDSERRAVLFGLAESFAAEAERAKFGA